jgi:holo-ACP synthase CitX
MIDQILLAREARMIHFKKALENSPMVLLIKANIPGNNKNIWISKYLVLLFKRILEHTCEPCESYSFESMDGPYVMIYLPQDDPLSIKHFLMHIEETHPLGRFIDLDLFNNPTKSISRSDIDAPLRTCIMCNQPAIECMRNHNHSTLDIMDYIEEKTTSYLLNDIKKLIDLSILTELELEDKFGLVTKTSSGSHPDMDYNLMVKAKNAIIDDLIEIYKLSLEDNSLDQLFPLAKEIGINAEKNMLKVTHGINCYKGLITVLGFACLSSGYALKHQQNFSDIFDNIKILSKDLKFNSYESSHTFGMKAYQKYQFLGIRGELHHGLPTVNNILKSYNHLSLDDSTNLRKALRDIITLCEDTVFLKRSHTLKNYDQIKNEISLLDMDNLIDIKDFTQKMISSNISFGGSADLLVTAIFLLNIKHLYT